MRELLQEGKDQGLFQIESVSYAMLQVMGVALAHKRAKNSRFGFDYQHMNTDELAEKKDRVSYFEDWEVHNMNQTIQVDDETPLCTKI